jgi:hypothetical protein
MIAAFTNQVSGEPGAAQVEHPGPSPWRRYSLLRVQAGATLSPTRLSLETRRNIPRPNPPAARFRAKEQRHERS